MLYNLRKILLIVLALFFAVTNELTAKVLEIGPSQFSKNNEIVVQAWNSKEGLEKLGRSQYKNDFYQLANFFQTQINPFYCGVATSVMLLNALNAPEVKTETKKSIVADLLTGSATDYLAYNQNNLLNEKTDKIKDRKIIEFKNVNEEEKYHDPGIDLKDLAAIMESYDLKTKIVFASSSDKKSIDEFRELIKKIVVDQDRFIVANFLTKAIGFRTGGHHSPVVAYDEESDSVLVMDVSYKRPWFWVPVDHLYKSMNTKDGKKYRGYLVVWKK